MFEIIVAVAVTVAIFVKEIRGTDTERTQNYFKNYCDNNGIKYNINGNVFEIEDDK